MNLHPLRQYRQDKGITLEDVAKAVGTSSATISRIERRKQAASWSLVAKLREVTNGRIRADDFLPETTK